MGYAPIRSLREFYALGGQSQSFSVEYAGAYMPPRDPHSANWNVAEAHWRRFVGEVMGTTAVPSELTGAPRVLYAEKWSTIVLWALVMLKNCPRCPQSARVDDAELQRILREAESV